MEGLTAEQLKDFEDAFKMFDKNNDGSISGKELGDAMRVLGQNPTDAELKDMVKDVDDDENGCIEFEEFVGFMRKRMEVCPDPEADLRGAFGYFDKNNDGFISEQELLAVLTMFGEQDTIQEAKTMMADVDLNKDGKIDYKEFVAFMQRV